MKKLFALALTVFFAVILITVIFRILWFLFVVGAVLAAVVVIFMALRKK